MGLLDRIQDSFKYLDKNGLKKVLSLVKNHDVHWTGTHAEYEAQKDSIPAYAILHFTDDYDENVQVGIYSTEETKTGEIWINGKPIYRKVFPMDVNVQTSTWNTVASVAGMNIEKLVRGWGTSPQYGSCLYNDLIQVNGNNLQVWPGGYGIRLDNVIIEYTKTTD